MYIYIYLYIHTQTHAHIHTRLLIFKLPLQDSNVIKNCNIFLRFGRNISAFPG